MTGESGLGDKARNAIQAAGLPHRRPDRLWGGPGLGIDCRICGAPVTRDEVGYEIEFAGSGDGDDSGSGTYHVHIPCFMAWEVELRKVEHAVGTAPRAGSDDSRLSPPWLTDSRASD